MTKESDAEFEFWYCLRVLFYAFVFGASLKGIESFAPHIAEDKTGLLLALVVFLGHWAFVSGSRAVELVVDWVNFLRGEEN